MTRLGCAIALVAITAAGAALRLAALGDAPPGLYPDEAVNGNDALQVAESGNWDWFYPGNNGREGLYVNLQAAALAATGMREPWVLRLVSALAGILTIPGMYLLGRAIWDRRAGLVVAALLAGSYWHVTFSRVGFRAILAPLFLVWSLGLLLAGIRRLRDGGRFGSALIVGSGIVAGLGLHSYIAFRAMAIPFLFVAALATWHARAGVARQDIARALALGALAAAIAAAPLLLYFARHPGTFAGRAAQVSVFSQAHPWQELARNTALETGMLVLRGDANWRHNYPRRAELPLLLAPFLVAGAALLALRTWRARGSDIGEAAVLVLFVAALLPAVTSGEGMPHALRGILLVVPALLMATNGILAAARAIERRGMRVAGGILVTGLVLYGAWDVAARYPAYAGRRETYHEFTTPYLETGRRILARDRNRPAYVIVPDGDVRIDGIPVAAQTVMFVTATATREAQERERVFYVTDPDDVPGSAATYDLR